MRSCALPASTSDPVRIRQTLLLCASLITGFAAASGRMIPADEARSANAAASDSPDSAAAFRWEVSAEHGLAHLYYGDRQVVAYQFGYDPSPDGRDATYKVYHHVFSPAADTLLTKGAGGQFPHHRGLFVGWNRTSDKSGHLWDFWHCPGQTHQRHERFLDQTATAAQGNMTAEIAWKADEDTTIISERRQLTATPIRDQRDALAWQLDWTSELRSQQGELRLEGDRQHAGFQMRAAQAVAEAQSARYIRPAAFPQDAVAVQVDDATMPGEHVDLGWFAMTFELDGLEHTMAYFEDPSLPKPSRYSERPYGRCGAFFTATLPADQPLRLRYRVLVTSGPEAANRDWLQSRYDEFCLKLAATPSNTAR